MLTPKKINELVQVTSKNHTQPRYGLYPPNKKILSYIATRIKNVNLSKVDDLEKVQEMITILEGFIRYLDNINNLLRLDIEKILVYIYYPDTEENTLANKDNLLLGSKGETVRLWHDAYYLNNRGPIINRLIDCKNVLYHQRGGYEYTQHQGSGMPEQMEKKYQEMLLGAPTEQHTREPPSSSSSM